MFKYLAKAKAAWIVLRKGRIVANPEAWKKGQVTVNLLFGFFSAVVVALRLFGIDLGLTDDQLLEIATGIFTVVGVLFNPYVTIATTQKIGLQADDSYTPTETGARDISSPARKILGGD